MISLALGGAAFGVAYLTAYSAFALFGYLPTMQGLGLLVLTALAPAYSRFRAVRFRGRVVHGGSVHRAAFAVDDPGPRVVYGYYIAASLLTLAMVSFRGWRPLIHLSFLFTLAGSAFFAWTAGYFVAGNSAVCFHYWRSWWPFTWRCRSPSGAGRAASSSITRHVIYCAAGGRGDDRAGAGAVARCPRGAILVVCGYLARGVGLAVQPGREGMARTPSSVC